jgi:hypothetical protein
MNSLFESEGGKKLVKVRNFQALIGIGANNYSKSASGFASLMYGAPNNTPALSKAKDEASNAVPEELLQ